MKHDSIQLPATLAFAANVRRAFVVLNPGRGAAHAKSTSGGMQRDTLRYKQRSELPNVLAYAAPDASGVALGSGIALAFRAPLERPQPVHVIVELVDESLLRLPVDLRTLVALPGKAVQGSATSLLAGPREYVVELWSAVEGAKDSAGRFFADLDRRTHPQLIDACHREWPNVLPKNDLLATRVATSSLMVAFGEHLRERTRARNGALARSHLHEHLRTHVRFIGRLFVDLARRYFPSRAGKDSVDTVAFGAAFERFALGELAVTLPSGFVTTQPSSGYYVFFGELALFHSVLFPEDGVWLELARAMVRTQEPFFRSHLPGTTTASLGIADYGPHTFDATAAAALRNGPALAQLRQSFGASSFSSLATQSSTLARAFLPAVV